MLAIGFGVLVLVIFGAAIRSALAIAAAYALTTLLALPSLVDVLAWLAAGGYVVLNIAGAVVAIAALLNAGKTQRRFR